MSNYINFVLTGDKNYPVPITVAITSIVANIDKSRTCRFFLLTTGFTEKDIKIAEKLKKKYKLEIINLPTENYLYLFDSVDTGSSKTPYVSLATYYRFLMFKILPDDVDKCFYIDGDIIVGTDLSIIYDELSTDKIASVVVEPLATQYKKSILSHCYELECFSNYKKDSSKYPYFNAGFLLFNIKMAKDLNIFQKLIDFMKIYPEIPYLDQDTLNAVVGQQYSNIINYLDPSYNVFCDMDYSVPFDDAYYPEEVIKESFKNPKIYHFGGPNKPWINNKVAHNYDVWWSYCKISPYKKLCNKDKKFISITENEKYKFYKFGFIKVTIKKQKKIDIVLQRIQDIDNNLGYLFQKTQAIDNSLDTLFKKGQDIDNSLDTLFKKGQDIDNSLDTLFKKGQDIDNSLDTLFKKDQDVYNSLSQLFNYCNFLRNSFEVVESVILENYLKNNINNQHKNYYDFINYLFNAKKIVSSSWTPNIDDVFTYFKFIFKNSEFEMLYNDKTIYADIYAFWGTRPMPSQLSIIKNAIINRKNIVIFEIGFINMIYYSPNLFKISNYSKSISFMFDDLYPYYDGRFKSRLEELLEDKKVVIDKEKIERAKKLIDHIIKNRITKYNHQPIYKPNIGSVNKKKVLVIDQAFGDMSIYKGMANKDTFKYMLEKAINDNPNYDVIIKSHPDAAANLNNSYYSKDDLKDNVYLMSEEINPISLLEIADKVYVCSSQLGFEALMMGKDVHVFGMPFYAGWGVTIDYQKCERRTNKRTIEEIFYIAYIMYTYYVNPEKEERCEIEDAIDYLIKLRKEYFDEFNIRCDDKDLL